MGGFSIHSHGGSERKRKAAGSVPGQRSRALLKRQSQPVLSTTIVMRVRHDGPGEMGWEK